MCDSVTLMNTETMLTIRDVAGRLGVHVNTVRNYISRGDLRSQKIGPKLVRVDEADLKSFIQGANDGTAA